MHNSRTQYRYDIDCLRCFAVFSVILFHCGFSLFSGGFIGVDIFFVISGYIMMRTSGVDVCYTPTKLIHFYKKRLLRIYPALLVTLCFSFIGGFFLLGVEAFDYFGKQLFFAAFSASNILFAQGHNYFSNDTPLLLHSWSLAVEMQFYMLFPFLIILLSMVSRIHKKAGALGFLISLFLCATLYAALNSHESRSFYLLQNRAFEFVFGMLICIVPLQIKHEIRRIIAVLCFLVLCICIFVFPNNSYHPGLMTLIPVLFSGLFIRVMAETHLVQNKLTVFLSYIGRLSYGIYLIHFPVSVFTALLFPNDPWIILLANIFITMPMASLSYHFIETPIRRIGYEEFRKAALPITGIISFTLALAACGFIVAKKQGLIERFRIFNPYAYSVSQIHTPYKEYYTRGYDVKNGDRAKILFIGDSVLQQYIDPITKSFGFSHADVDVVSRGGCVLLKNVDFKDVFADISCNDLRERLYALDKKYDYVVLSQNWNSYRNAILNAVPSDDYQYIQPFTEDTLAHFSMIADNIILLGIHPAVTIKIPLSIDMFLSKTRYDLYKNTLSIADHSDEGNRDILEKIAQKYSAHIIHPIDIFCDAEGSAQQCTLSNDQWAFFSDGEHLTQAGQNKASAFFTEHFGTNAQYIP